MIVGHLARMIKLNPLCGIIALTLCLAGCSASGARFQDTPFATQPIADDKSRIIFYRESDADFRSVTLGIDDSIDAVRKRFGAVNVEVGQVPGAEDLVPGAILYPQDPTRRLYLYFHDEQMHSLRGMSIGKFVMSMTVVGGETYYIRASYRAERMLYPLMGPIGVALVFADIKGEFQLEPVTAAVALQALKELKLSE